MRLVAGSVCNLQVVVDRMLRLDTCNDYRCNEIFDEGMFDAHSCIFHLDDVLDLEPGWSEWSLRGVSVRRLGGTNITMEACGQPDDGQ